MRKTYYTPQTIAVRVTALRMIATTVQSPGSAVQSTGNSATLSFGNVCEDGDASAAASRGGSWTDE